MVRALFGLLLWFVTLSTQAITPEELRALTNDAEQQQRARDGRLKSDELSKLVPQPKQQEERAATAPANARSTKYDTPAPSSPRDGAFSSAPEARRALTSVGGKAPASTLGTSGGAIFSDAVVVDNKRIFGVRLGTWMEARINRDTTSAEPGLVELTVTSDVVGDKKTLPSGTLLFAQKQLNSATKRMELKVQKGITPKGLEFQMNGQIYDTLRVSGLQGIISGDTDASIKRGASKGALAAVSAAARSIPGPLSQAGGAAVDSVANDAGRVIDETTEQRLTIYVASQPVLIRVEDTF